MTSMNQPSLERCPASAPGARAPRPAAWVLFTALLTSLGCGEGETIEEGAAGFPNTCPSDPSSTAQDMPRPLPQRALSRPVALACERERPCAPVEKPFNCASHADCRSGVNGRCSSGGHECTYDECFRDEDCPGSEVCDCAGGDFGSHRCVSADCRVDADCGEGWTCSPSFAHTCPEKSARGYFCHREADTCTVDSDCEQNQQCAFDLESDAWRCAGWDYNLCIR